MTLDLNKLGGVIEKHWQHKTVRYGLPRGSGTPRAMKRFRGWCNEGMRAQIQTRFLNSIRSHMPYKQASMFRRKRNEQHSKRKRAVLRLWRGLVDLNFSLQQQAQGLEELVGPGFLAAI